MDTASQKAIQVTNLTRTYQASKKAPFTAVNNVSFEVARSEAYGLLGTNGAGKTSILDILEGLAPALIGLGSSGGYGSAEEPLKFAPAYRHHAPIRWLTYTAHRGGNYHHVGGYLLTPNARNRSTRNG